MAEMDAKPKPVTNEEWAVHALNIQGIFFERRCQQVVQKAEGWMIQETNYPVEHRGKASDLDIWVEREDSNSSTRVTVPIECKKNNPEFVDWIFFPQPVHRPPDSTIQMLQQRRPERGWWYMHREFRRLEHDLMITDEGRETKGDYQKIKNLGNKTKTANDSITGAAAQVALATFSLLEQEHQIMVECQKANKEHNIRVDLTRFWGSSALSVLLILQPCS